MLASQLSDVQGILPCYFTSYEVVRDVARVASQSRECQRRQLLITSLRSSILKDEKDCFTKKKKEGDV